MVRANATVSPAKTALGHLMFLKPGEGPKTGRAPGPSQSASGPAMPAARLSFIQTAETCQQEAQGVAFAPVGLCPRCFG